MITFKSSVQGFNRLAFRSTFRSQTISSPTFRALPEIVTSELDSLLITSSPFLQMISPVSPSVLSAPRMPFTSSFTQGEMKLG